jgi:methylmalonyl-CoA mutase N-terminal domain/subunit
VPSAGLEHLRDQRDNEQAQRCLEALREACQGSDNLMHPILDAVNAYCTLGEVCNVMREVFGEYQERLII